MSDEVKAERERCLAILREVEARHTPPASHVGSIVNLAVNALREAAHRIGRGDAPAVDVAK